MKTWPRVHAYLWRAVTFSPLAPVLVGIFEFFQRILKAEMISHRKWHVIFDLSPRERGQKRDWSQKYRFFTKSDDFRAKMGMPVPAEPEMIESWNFVPKVVLVGPLRVCNYSLLSITVRKYSAAGGFDPPPRVVPSVKKPVYNRVKNICEPESTRCIRKLPAEVDYQKA